MSRLHARLGDALGLISSAHAAAQKRLLRLAMDNAMSIGIAQHVDSAPEGEQWVRLPVSNEVDARAEVCISHVKVAFNDGQAEEGEPPWTIVSLPIQEACRVMFSGGD